MKRIAWIFPLIVSWKVNYWVPNACPKGQVANPYLGYCLVQGTFDAQKVFTEQKDYDQWTKGIPKDDPRFSITDVKVFEYDQKRSPAGPK